MIEDGYECSINSLDAWLQEQAASASPSEVYTSNCGGATGLPIAQENFHSCMIGWSRLVNDQRVLQLDGKIRLLLFDFRSRVRYDSPYDALNAEWKAIESWMDERIKDAPAEVDGVYFSSDDFWWYDTNGGMLRTAYGAAGIAVGAAAAVVLFSSRSFVISVFCLVTIFFILASVTAIIVGLGWDLGL